MTGKIIDFEEMLRRKEEQELMELQEQQITFTYGEMLDTVEATTFAWLETQVQRSDVEWMNLKNEIIAELEIRNANT